MKHYLTQTNEIRAIEEGQEFLVQSDWKELTQEELEAKLAPTPEQLEEQRVAEAKTYLSSTDYKMTVDYFATLSQDVQDELIKLRAEARKFIRENEE